MASLETEEGGHCGEVGVLYYGACYTVSFFFSGNTTYCVKFLLPVAYNGNPIIN